MADKKTTFRIDLDHPGAINALRAYAKASPDAKEKLEIEDLIEDTAHAQRKAKRRAELTTATAQADKQRADVENVLEMPTSHEPADSEEDTEDLDVDQPA